MDYNNQNMTPPPYYGHGAAVTTQTNSVMKRVYVRMTVGLLISAFCALGVASSQAAMMFIFGNQLVFWGIFIAMLAMAWILPARMAKMSTSTCLLLFCVFSALMGVWLAPVFLAYRIGTIVYTFFITAGTFGAMSVYGYFTTRDLTSWGRMLTFALIGLIICCVVNIFLKSSGMDFIVSIAGVLIFIGLTAWDTQKIKRWAEMSPAASTSKLATIGALSLYLDFINLFLYLLRFFGNSRN